MVLGRLLQNAEAFVETCLVQQASKHVLENASGSGVCANAMSYYECLDTVMEKSKALGDGMTGIANHAKKSEHDEFGESVKSVSDAICGLVEAAAQSAYLVGVSDPSSVTGRAGLIDQTQFVKAAQAIKQACQVFETSFNLLSTVKLHSTYMNNYVIDTHVFVL